MNTIVIWILVLIGLGLFVYFVPYKNIKINVQNNIVFIYLKVEMKNSLTSLVTFLAAS